MKNYIFFTVFIFLCSVTLPQTNWYIDNEDNNGDGSLEDPFNDWSTAIDNMEPGDFLNVLPGTYLMTGALSFDNSGDADNWFTIKAHDPGNKPVLQKTSDTRLILLDNDHYYKFENLILDGDFHGDQLVIIRNNASNIRFNNCILKENRVDAVSIENGDKILFDGCEIFFSIRYEDGNQVDAHGIMFRRGGTLTVKNCDIHHHTGDCIQIGTPEEPPVWDSVFVYNTILHTGTLDSDINGLPAGTYIGENAFDTKTIDISFMTGDLENYRGYCYLENVTVHGFNRALNYSSFNIKRTVDVTLKNCVAYDNWIAFRIRGNDHEGNPERDFIGAYTKMINCIAYDNQITLWPEADIDSLKIYNCTFDKQDGYDYFDSRTSYNEGGFDMRNCIFYGVLEEPALLSETNYQASDDDFEDRESHDYRITETSPARGAGVVIPMVTTDFYGNPMNDPPDVGAIQFGSEPIVAVHPSLDQVDILSLFPNPADDNCNVLVNTSSTDNFVIHVFDIYGKLVFESTGCEGSCIVEIPANLMTPGIYFVGGRIGTRLLKMAKLVIK
ncbi:MAG: T9SS type A sorting domain-containing protein [Bacteroidales bacterium]|nr:T9SS type A sorting domain-containing protein [Bacteroidales bacterium]